MKKQLWPADKIERVEWRPVVGCAGYEVSTAGEVRSIDRILTDGRRWKGRIRKQKIAKGGYLTVGLGMGKRGATRHAIVHRLVAEAFIGPQPSPAHQVAHNDGNPKNNRLDNLRWATALENARDRDRHGRTAQLKGSCHGQSKLSETSVKKLRALKSDGATVDQLAALFGVSRWTVFDALSGRTWGHV